MKVRLISRKLEVSPSVVLLFLKDVMYICRDWAGDWETVPCLPVERETFGWGYRGGESSFAIDLPTAK